MGDSGLFNMIRVSCILLPLFLICFWVRFDAFFMAHPFFGFGKNEGPIDQVDCQGGVGQMPKELSGDQIGDLEEV